MKKICLTVILTAVMALSGCADSRNANTNPVQQFQSSHVQSEPEVSQIESLTGFEPEVSPIESLTGIDKKIYEIFIDCADSFYIPQEPRILEILGSDPLGEILVIRISGYLDGGVRYMGINGMAEGAMAKEGYGLEIVDFDGDVDLGKINRAITQHWQDLGIV